MTINAKLRLAFLLVALLLLGSTAVQRWMTAHILIDQQLDQLETAAEIQKRQLDALITNNGERLALVASRTRLRTKLNDHVKGVGTAEDTRVEVERILRDALSSIPDFEAIVVTSLNGRVIASTNEGEAGRDAAKESWYLKGRDGPSLNTFALGEDGEPRCFLSTSLTWRTGRSGW